MSHGSKNYPGNAPFSDEEMRILRSKPSTSEVINTAKNIVKQKVFNVGDTLIALDIKNENKPYLDNNNHKPQKFIVQFKDEADMLYCRKINADGKLSKSIELIAGWDHERWMFIQDPEAADHVLLGSDDYDPFKDAKKAKKLKDQIARHNKKLRIKFADLLEVKKWMDSLSVGTKIYKKGYKDVEEYEVTQILPKSIKVKCLKGGWNLNQIEEWQSERFTSKYYEFYNSPPRMFVSEKNEL